jgi:hypothetical protein
MKKQKIPKLPPGFSEPPTAIIVTFPVQFLIDLGNSVLLQKEVKAKRKKKKEASEILSMAAGKHIFLLANRTDTILTGYKECIRQINNVNYYNARYPDSETPMMWHHSMGNKPSFPVQHCYVNILNKIRFKATVVDMESAPKGELIEYEFKDSRKWTGRNWLFLMNFERLNPEIKMGGFQGFRYWKEDYICNQPKVVNKRLREAIEIKKLNMDILKSELDNYAE